MGVREIELRGKLSNVDAMQVTTRDGIALKHVLADVYYDAHTCDT